MIELTKELVGIRAMTSEGEVVFFCDYHEEKNYLLAQRVMRGRRGPWIKCYLETGNLYGVHGEMGHTIALLLDAPNPFDVPVPSWCERVTLWYRNQPKTILSTLGSSPEEVRLWLEREAARVDWLTGWSPAPGVLRQKPDRPY